MGPRGLLPEPKGTVSTGEDSPGPKGRLTSVSTPRPAPRLPAMGEACSPVGLLVLGLRGSVESSEEAAVAPAKGGHFLLSWVFPK